MIISDLLELNVSDSFYNKNDNINIFKFGDRFYIVSSNNRIYLLSNNDKNKFEKGLKKLGYTKEIFK